MAMADFEIPENPEFSQQVRKFETTDPAHADLFNAVVQSLLNNDAFLKIVTEQLQQTITQHMADAANPHKITADQLGLGAVDNTADTDKPVSTAQQAAQDALYTQLAAYVDKKTADLINGAPSTLDTLGEIADAMAESADVVSALNSAIGTKANAAEFDSHMKDKTAHVTEAERREWNSITPEKIETEVSRAKAAEEANKTAIETEVSRAKAAEEANKTAIEAEVIRAKAAEKQNTHPTTSGYKHIPSGGSSGKILKWSADGTAKWDDHYPCLIHESSQYSALYISKNEEHIIHEISGLPSDHYVVLCLKFNSDFLNENLSLDNTYYYLDLFVIYDYGKYYLKTFKFFENTDINDLIDIGYPPEIGYHQGDKTQFCYDYNCVKSFYPSNDGKISIGVSLTGYYGDKRLAKEIISGTFDTLNFNIDTYVKVIDLG